MNNGTDTTPIYVECQRCGKKILEQSSIEEDGMVLCGECLVKDVKKDVSEAEQQVLEQRNIERQEQLKEARKQHGRRVISILLAFMLILGVISFLVNTQRDEPVASQTINPGENLDITKSVIAIALYKYQRDNEGAKPEQLKDLVPRYLETSLLPVLNQFNYNAGDKNGYILEIKKAEKPQDNTVKDSSVGNDVVSEESI